MINMITPMTWFVVVNTIHDYMSMYWIWTHRLSIRFIFVLVVSAIEYIIYSNLI
jgi:hypothetical protein